MNLEDTLSFVLLVIHLNMLDLVLVTILLHSQISKIVQLVDEELLAQSTKREGGINFYTGMNDKGISYSGNKRLSTITGREEIFDTPVQTVEGEDIAGSKLECC